MRRALNVLLAVAVLGAALIAALGGGAYAYVSSPGGEALPLPADAVAVQSERGQRLLNEALAADHAALSSSFQPQQKRSWCGVASAVAVLNARGGQLTQEGFFSPEASEVRSFWAVTFGGMSLVDLAGLLSAHGVSTTVHHAGGEQVEAFRDALKRGLSDPEDQLIVNYHRPTLHEEGGGHLSPVSAFHVEADLVLILDTASYKYPAHWVPVQALFAAMNTIDPSTGQSRGWVSVR